MGLDIFAASHLRYARPLPDEEELDRWEQEIESQGKSLDEVHFLLRPNEAGWEAQLAGMEPGVYEYTPATQRHGFRVGSYSGYNWWREQLSRYALGVEPEAVWEDPGRFAGKPFVELINFTDCDGCIGTAVAANLAGDFRQHAAALEAASRSLVNTEGFLYVYREFTRAFGLAAQQGALKFC